MCESVGHGFQKSPTKASVNRDWGGCFSGLADKCTNLEAPVSGAWAIEGKGREGEGEGTVDSRLWEANQFPAGLSSSCMGEASRDGHLSSRLQRRRVAQGGEVG